MDSRDVFQALQPAVSPVILISAYGLLLLSMTNRLLLLRSPAAPPLPTASVSPP